MTKIKNVVFDIGNVLVHWDPYGIIEQVFPEVNGEDFYQRTIRPEWLDLNRGKFTEAEAVEKWHVRLGIPKDKLEQLMLAFKVSQTALPGSFELLDKLHKAKVPLYSITDNVHEIMEYHRANSGFLSKFIGIIVSADIAALKPEPIMYETLLRQYNLSPIETVFIDDLKKNVEGAINAGMHAFQFINAEQCEQQLHAIGVEF